MKNKLTYKKSKQSFCDDKKKYLNDPCYYTHLACVSMSSMLGGLDFCFRQRNK